MALRRAQQRQLREALPGRVDQASSRVHEVPGQPLHRRVVEEIGVVAQSRRRRSPPLRRDRGSDRTWRPRRSASNGSRVSPGSSSAPAAEAAWRLEGHPQQRRPVRIARQRQLVHQPLEREVLVGVGAPSTVSRDPGQQRRRGRDLPRGPPRSTRVLTKKPISLSISLRDAAGDRRPDRHPGRPVSR